MGSWRRRKFVGMGVSAAVSLPALACARAGSPWRFFTADEARTVEAICEQIISADQDAGAASAGVVNYIDRQLTGFLKRLQKTYRAGIAGVNQASVARRGKRFVELAGAEQIEILQGLEKDPASKPFFDLVVAHTMQGFYGSPRHGGNRDWVSWKMLGVPCVPVRGRAT